MSDFPLVIQRLKELRAKARQLGRDNDVQYWDDLVRSQERLQRAAEARELRLMLPNPHPVSDEDWDAISREIMRVALKNGWTKMPERRISSRKKKTRRERRWRRRNR